MHVCLTFARAARGPSPDWQQWEVVAVSRASESFLLNPQTRAPLLALLVVMDVPAEGADTALIKGVIEQPLEQDDGTLIARRVWAIDPAAFTPTQLALIDGPPQAVVMPWSEADGRVLRHTSGVYFGAAML